MDPAAISGGIVNAADQAAQQVDPAQPVTSAQPATTAQPPAPEKPNLWKSVLVGALAGLAGSAGAKSFGGGLAQGAAGEMQNEQLQKTNALRQQQQANENQAATDEHTRSQAQTAMAYANLAHLNRQISLLPPDRQTAAVEARADQTEALRRTGAMSPAGAAGDYHEVLNQVTELHKKNPERLFTPEPIKGPDGKITWQAFESTDAPIQEDVKVDLPNGQSVTIPKGSASGKQVSQFQLGAMQKMLENQTKAEEKAPPTKEIMGSDNKAHVMAFNKKTGKYDADQGLAVPKGTATNIAALTPDALGFEPKLPVNGAAGYAKIASSFKKNIDDLSQTDQAYSQFADILKDINSGKDLTGAQSIVSLFNAIGISAEPLKGKGFRINNLTVAEHAQARGLREAIEQKIGKLKTGEIITPNQLRDYANIASQVRENKYTALVNQMHNAGLNADQAMPTGNGQKADPGTARIFLRLVGWTGGQPSAEQKQRAQDAMQKKGWAQ